MKKNKSNSEKYSWGNNCTGWHLVKSSSLGIIQESMPPGTEEVKHKHQYSQQFFFILKGKALFELELKLVEVTAGEGIHILPGQIHKIINGTQEELEFIVISEPHSHGDRIVFHEGNDNYC